jgi:catechol 2,3-dioxygenase-like lactoylglutathione lyase family enzyme
VSEIQLDHIAIATHRLTDAPPFLVGVLGGIPFFGMDAGVFRFGQWEFDGDARIEILEPRGSNGFVHRFLATRGPGIHHVTFKVPSLRDTCDRAESLGYAIVGYNDANPYWKEAFLHPKDALGIVVQLAQAAGKGPTRGKWRTAPAGPANPPPPVRIVGLRTRARSEERARRQWSMLLHGDAHREDDMLVYRWPQSPLAIAVEIDAAAEEGALQIDIVSARPLPPLDTADTALGAVFALQGAR